MTAHVTELAAAAKIARGLAIDAIDGCSSGHLGLPLGAAEVGAALFGELLRFDPADPRWLNRDRFVLSAGHGSMFLYAWLHLAGYDLSLDDIKDFRKLDSRTPGHPEFGMTPGVEATTGPLGQGVANAVGMAVAARMTAARFNDPEDEEQLLDYRVVVLAGDGCLQEGVALEATELAGHLGLDNLILIHDANGITLDAPLDASQSRDTAARFRAVGWDVQDVDGHDIEAFCSAYHKARTTNSGRPQLIMARTEIARGIPEVAGTPKGHGEGGTKFAESARKALGLPEERFYVSQEVRDFFATRVEKLRDARKAWEGYQVGWRLNNPHLAAELDAGIKRKFPSNFAARIPDFPSGKSLATRAAAGQVLQELMREVPQLIGMSADLYGSNQNYLKDGGDFGRDTPTGRNLRVGVREHAMGAMLNGFAYHGLYHQHGATFLVFADYLRPAIRMAALSHLPVVYYLTHDSIGVGEDGPTHQPVETISSLRLIPNLEVHRPADAEETVGSVLAAFDRQEGPAVLALSRQALPLLEELPVAERRTGASKGGYVLRAGSEQPELLLMASGSEVALAVQVADLLKERGVDAVRIVSLPCLERFDRQLPQYREGVIPPSCKRRVAIEAGVSDPWYHRVGEAGLVIGVDRFGMSAPAGEIFKKLGLDAGQICDSIVEHYQFDSSK